MAGFESGLFQKRFKDYILFRLVPSVDQYIFELFARETNLMEKRSVGLKNCKETHDRTVNW